MTDEDVAMIADCLQRRNVIDQQIAAITQRPMTAGHLGEWIASRVFDIQLENSAVSKAIDGRFRTGPLTDRTVNVKWYGKREGLLDTVESEVLDYYLVLTGPKSLPVSSQGTTRPWCIDNVYLFDAHELTTDRLARGNKVGVASSVRQALWAAAEVYPENSRSVISLTTDQVELLVQFHSTRLAG